MIDESRVAHREEAGHMSTNLTIDEKLFAEAQRLTGLKKKTDLLREELQALIERESARRLA
jgi:Arc/MetJ family transcription regulator